MASFLGWSFVYYDVSKLRLRALSVQSLPPVCSSRLQTGSTTLSYEWTQLTTYVVGS